ncbi:hypothetical protein Lalb_Chr05g0211371 [Lupinus albus]|uniref:Uncharacterized protein n=1 Tax=Lupinus albus TaxID=3870 RepID=A0A6A4QGR3_LUPAL|nr:hypothetical protein Lalb_Chr05g0211371 [Lupinus albus]
MALENNMLKFIRNLFYYIESENRLCSILLSPNVGDGCLPFHIHQVLDAHHNRYIVMMIGSTILYQRNDIKRVAKTIYIFEPQISSQLKTIKQTQKFGMKIIRYVHKSP